ncbi:hypothetical protein N658DRAFT_501796 [Parathielavia hyrcaniae]|uniref:Uncharacterized protein n=1 Tax=Parathielavia hyrcaniae TaxID=113614 RepID=A0AAN6PQR7_9PEZI|nr:hypothetical protein N658DRAFT_501796 [Parathielavia hyrcaniae]
MRLAEKLVLIPLTAMFSLVGPDLFRFWLQWDGISGIASRVDLDRGELKGNSSSTLV